MADDEFHVSVVVGCTAALTVGNSSCSFLGGSIILWSTAALSSLAATASSEAPSSTAARLMFGLLSRLHVSTSLEVSFQENFQGCMNQIIEVDWSVIVFDNMQSCCSFRQSLWDMLKQSTRLLTLLNYLQWQLKTACWSLEIWKGESLCSTEPSVLILSRAYTICNNFAHDHCGVALLKRSEQLAADISSNVW